MQIRRGFPILLLTVFGAIIAGCALSENSRDCDHPYARIVRPEMTGILFDETGLRIPNARVIPIVVNTSPVKPPSDEAITDADGRFQIPCFAAGTYGALQRMPQVGYRPSPRMLVVLADGRKFLFWPSWDNTGLRERLPESQRTSPSYEDRLSTGSIFDMYPLIGSAEHIPVGRSRWPINQNGLRLIAPIDTRQ
jgi:hypothetical protein